MQENRKEAFKKKIQKKIILYKEKEITLKQGRIHDNISHVRVGRGKDAVYLAFRCDFAQRDGPTNRPTDRVTHKKKINNVLIF